MFDQKDGNESSKDELKQKKTHQMRTSSAHFICLALVHCSNNISHLMASGTYKYSAQI